MKLLFEHDCNQTIDGTGQTEGGNKMPSMKNDVSSNQRGPKRAGGRSSKKGSPVTEERAKAQRAKLDAQAETRQREEEQEAATHITHNKKTARQEIQPNGG
jgi:hypothetical protein